MKILITGGGGFIGCNAAQRLMQEGHSLSLLDNLSRRGSDQNLAWLRGEGDFEFINADIRDAEGRSNLQAIRP